MKCRLLYIKCYQTSESDGDEIYLKFNGSKLWPKDSGWHRLITDSEARLDVQVPNDEKQNELVIDLYDQDSLIDDKLGTFKLDLSPPGGSFTTDMGSAREGARYTLGWEAYR